MKKTTLYSRKRASKNHAFNGAEWLNAIGRCRPYMDEKVVGSWLPQGTTQLSDRVLVDMRMAYQLIKDGLVPSDDTEKFDALAHMAGVAKIRAIQIAGEKDNPLLGTICLAEDALIRMRDRYQKMRIWGFDGPGLSEMSDALDIYEVILVKSSPQQMANATDIRISILKKMVASQNH